MSLLASVGWSWHDLVDAAVANTPIKLRLYESWLHRLGENNEERVAMILAYKEGGIDAARAYLDSLEIGS